MPPTGPGELEHVARALAGAAPEQQLALRALELAYLERTMSRERAADKLNVSRATFYRLLHRGVALLAMAFPHAAKIETPLILR